MMNDGELRNAFQRLRESERSATPRFAVPTQSPWALRPAAWGLLALLVLIIALAIPRHQQPPTASTTSFSTWKAPTDFLLRTPGRELVATTPDFKPEIPGGGS